MPSIARSFLLVLSTQYAAAAALVVVVDGVVFYVIPMTTVVTTAFAVVMTILVVLPRACPSQEYFLGREKTVVLTLNYCLILDSAIGNDFRAFLIVAINWLSGTEVCNKNNLTPVHADKVNHYHHIHTVQSQHVAYRDVVRRKGCI